MHPMHLLGGSSRDAEVGGFGFRILGHPRHTHNDGAWSDLQMIFDDDHARDHRSVSDDHRTSDSGVADNIDEASELTIVADVDLIIQFGVVTYPCAFDGGTVNGAAGPNFHVIPDDHVSDMRDFITLSRLVIKTEAIGSNDRSP